MKLHLHGFQDAPIRFSLSLPKSIRRAGSGSVGAKPSRRIETVWHWAQEAKTSLLPFIHEKYSMTNPGFIFIPVVRSAPAGRTSQLPDLLLEILVAILNEFNTFTNIVSCQRVSQRPREIITDFTSIQYTIQKEIAGIQDNPGCKLPTGNCLSFKKKCRV